MNALGMGIAIVLALVSLPGCRNDSQESRDGNEGQDAAGQIMAEALRPSTTSPDTAQSPASILLDADTTPTLGALLGVAGTPFTSLDGGFGMTLPPGFPAFHFGQTVHQDHTVDYYASRTEHGSYVVAYWQHEGQTEDDLGRIIDRTAAEWNYDIESEERIAVQGQPALSVYMSGDQQYMRLNMVLTPRRIYVFRYVSRSRSDLDHPVVDASFRSFVLLE